MCTTINDNKKGQKFRIPWVFVVKVSIYGGFFPINLHEFRIFIYLLNLSKVDR